MHLTATPPVPKPRRISCRRAKRVRVFPTLILQRGEQIDHIADGYLPLDAVRAQLDACSCAKADRPSGTRVKCRQLSHPCHFTSGVHHVACSILSKVALFLLTLMLGMSGCGASEPGKQSVSTAPATGQPANPRVLIETSKGNVIVEVFPGNAPKSAANFLAM